MLQLVEAARRASSRPRRARPTASPARSSSALRAKRRVIAGAAARPRSASTGSVRVANQAGAAPKMMPVSSATPKAKASTSSDGRVLIGRNVRLREGQREQQPRGAHGDQQPRDAAGDREQHAFDERLRDDLPRASRRSPGAPPSARGARRRAPAAGWRRWRTRSAAPGRRRPTGSAGCVRTLPSSRRRRRPRARRDRLLGQHPDDVGHPVRGISASRAASTAAGRR